MARKSRKTQEILAVETSAAPLRAAVYIRLSVNDKHTKTVSIETQQLIIERFLEQNPEIAVQETYIDNGVSGMNFNRPAFQKMLYDIETGSLDCVIVKDLSRLGRNMIDAGYYLDQYFPSHNIRFISVNDNYDSAQPQSAASGLSVSLLNIANEAYAMDIGRKIRAQQQQAMKDGKYIGARPPYGYLKAEDDCHQLVIDPPAAAVVQMIFQWASEGAGLNTIVVRLNEARYITPSQYRQEQGIITHENLMGCGKWQTRTISRILRDMVYIGDMVQGKSKNIDHQQTRTDKESWTIVPDTHEPIVSREMYTAVQHLLDKAAQQSKERKVTPFTSNFLKGKIFCPHCGASLHRQRNNRDGKYLYYCLTRSRVSKDDCPGVLIMEDVLLDTLTELLQEALGTILGEYKLLLNNPIHEIGEREKLQTKIKELQGKINHLQGMERSLYESLIQKVITTEEYHNYKHNYDRQINDITTEIAQQRAVLKILDEQIRAYETLSQDAENLKSNRKLTAALIERLIDRVEVSHDKQITVKYRFQNEFEDYKEVLAGWENM